MFVSKSGTLWVTVTSFFFRDWHTAQRLNSLPVLITLLYPFFIPESPRWLVKGSKR